MCDDDPFLLIYIVQARFLVASQGVIADPGPNPKGSLIPPAFFSFWPPLGLVSVEPVAFLPLFRQGKLVGLVQVLNASRAGRFLRLPPSCTADVAPLGKYLLRGDEVPCLYTDGLEWRAQTPQMESHGSTTLPASTTTEGKRLRRACNACHRMKLRCSGTKPCARCQDTGNECVYAFVAKLGKPRGSRNKKTIERERERQRQASAAVSEQGEGEDGGEGDGEADTRSSSPPSPSPPPSLVHRKLTDSGDYSGDSCLSNSGPDTVDGMDWTALVHAAVTTPASLPIDPALGWMDGMDGLNSENCLQSTMCDLSGPETMTHSKLLEDLQSHWPMPVSIEDLALDQSPTVPANPAKPVPVIESSPEARRSPTLSTGQAFCGCLQTLFESLCSLRAPNTRGRAQIQSPPTTPPCPSGNNAFVATLNALSTLQKVQKCQLPTCHSDYETTELVILTVDHVFRRLQRLLCEGTGAEAMFTDLQLHLGGQTVSESEPLSLVRQALLGLVRERAQQAVVETRRRMGMLGTNLNTNAGADLEEALNGNTEKMYVVKLRMAGMRLDTMLQQIEWRLH
ncbi:hypothetical protein BDW67DRAFT_187263 [Aspergillus spinulosporus]